MAQNGMDEGLVSGTQPEAPLPVSDTAQTVSLADQVTARLNGDFIDNPSADYSGGGGAPEEEVNGYLANGNQRLNEIAEEDSRDVTLATPNDFVPIDTEATETPAETPLPLDAHQYQEASEAAAGGSGGINFDYSRYDSSNGQLIHPDFGPIPTTTIEAATRRQSLIGQYLEQQQLLQQQQQAQVAAQLEEKLARAGITSHSHNHSSHAAAVTNGHSNGHSNGHPHGHPHHKCEHRQSAAQVQLQEEIKALQRQEHQREELQREEVRRQLERQGIRSSQPSSTSQSQIQSQLPSHIPLTKQEIQQRTLRGNSEEAKQIRRMKPEKLSWFQLLQRVKYLEKELERYESERHELVGDLERLAAGREMTIAELKKSSHEKSKELTHIIGQLEHDKKLLQREISSLNDTLDEYKKERDELYDKIKSLENKLNASEKLSKDMDAKAKAEIKELHETIAREKHAHEKAVEKLKEEFATEKHHMEEEFLHQMEQISIHAQSDFVERVTLDAKQALDKFGELAEKYSDSKLSCERLMSELKSLQVNVHDKRCRLEAAENLLCEMLTRWNLHRDTVEAELLLQHHNSHLFHRAVSPLHFAPVPGGVCGGLACSATSCPSCTTAPLSLAHCSHHYGHH